jgi:hypothetical protein
MPKHSRRWTPSLRRRDSGRWSNRHAVVLIGTLTAICLIVVVAIVVRLDKDQSWPFNVHWDSSWPPLPLARVAGGLSDRVARAVYAVAGRHADVLQHMPCYCGCHRQGHKSNMQCFIKRRTAEGRVVEWDNHGRMCPFGPDIAGDAVLWHRNGTPLTRIRADIEREYSSRGPATPTPPVPTP